MWVWGLRLPLPTYQSERHRSAPHDRRARPRLSLPSGEPGPPGGAGIDEECYLVDPASSHMLVSKIKPCMSKYKQLYGETANGSLNQLSFI